LLVVVAIILIIAAIAIPNLLRARVAGNQSSAVGSLRALYSAATTYQSAFNVYPVSFAELASGSTAGTSVCGASDNMPINWNAAAVVLNGYNFTMGVGDGVAPTPLPGICPDGNSGFTAIASPSSGTPGTNGAFYCLDEKGTIYYSTTAAFAVGQVCATQGGTVLGN
jgi:type II secretory pathway pseudopilin PulG